MIQLAQLEDNSGSSCCHEIVINENASFILNSLLSILPFECWIKPDKTGFTSLHYSCESGTLEHFKTILNQLDHQTIHSALNLKTNEGLSLLHIGQKNKHYQIVDYLLKLNLIDSNARDKYSRLYSDL